jgi:hypothetical protein
MAGPHVAGLVALIISANPALRGHIDTIEDIIEQTAKPLTSNRGCGGDSSTQVPNNVFGWGRINALAAVQLAAMTDPDPSAPLAEGETLDPAHNAPIPCELISSLGALPRSAKNIAHVANVCGIVGTDMEFQSRTDADGVVHDYAFVGTMGAGTRIYDVTDPQLPRYVGGYLDPGWQNDVQVFGNTLIMAFDPLGGPVHLSDCLRSKNPTSTRGGVDIVNLQFDPLLATLSSPLTFQTQRIGCYLTTEGGGAHTITIHPSGEWLSLNTSASGIEVVDLRNNAFTFVRKIPSAIAASAHDIFFSRDGNTLYSAGVGSTRVIDVSDVFNRAPTLIANVPNSPTAEQGADGHVVQISHQSDTTADGRLMVVTDEKGGGLSNTACNTSASGAIGGAHFWALQELSESNKSAGASPSSPRKIGTWIYPNPMLAVDALDPVLAGLGRTERACTIHVYRLGGNSGQSPSTVGQGVDGNDAVSRLPINQMVSAHYGAGVWHVDVMSAPGPDDDSRTTWGRTLGWNVMPGADTWSAKEYKGYIYAGDMNRGFDVYRFADCDGVDCVDVLAPAPEPTGSATPTPTINPTPTATATATPTATATATSTPTPTLDPGQCVATWLDTLEPAAHPDWTTGTASNEIALSPTWSQAIDANAHSPSHSWSNDAKTLGLKDTRLIAPTQRLTRLTQLSFWHRYFMEAGFDGGVLEVTIDGGLSWADVTTSGSFVSGGYNDTISTEYGSAIAGRPAWSGGSETARLEPMTQVVVSLGGFVPAGQSSVNAQLRWRYAADEIAVGATPGDEWWIDDIEFANVEVNCANPTPTATATAAPTPTTPIGCTPDNVYFMGVVNDGNEPGEPREDFQADVRNFEYYLSTLKQTYCIPDSQISMLAFTDGWKDAAGNPLSPYPEASEANVKAEIARLGAAANQHSDSLFFFFLSSHGIVYTTGISECPVDRLAGSLSGLKSGNGETGDFYDCELGTALNTSFAPSTRMFVFVDCSVCGGFSDSLTAASGTIPDNSVPTSAGVVGTNRIVMTGCAMTTECFGSTPAENGGVSYYHLRNVMEAGVAACDGWTVPGFPTFYGLDVPVQGAPLNPPDGRCTGSEWFFGAVFDAYAELDEIAIQQQFRIKYGFDSLADDILIMPGGGPDPTPTPTPTPTATATATPTPTPTAAPADLIVNSMSAATSGGGKPKQGDPVLLSAVIANNGAGPAGASVTEFRVDDQLIGTVATPAIAAGGSVEVTIQWSTSSANGEYLVSARADSGAALAEADETNNLGQLAIEVRGNKVQNGDFERPSESGSGPANWESGSTAAGSTGYGEEPDADGSDGDSSNRTATISGTGRSVVIFGMPRWTSDPIAVSPGELLTLSVDVRTVGMSSAPTVGLAYLGTAGQVLSTVSMLSAPLNSGGAVTTLTRSFSVPLNAVGVRIVLTGFSPTDAATAGTVSFDNVGLYGE